MRTLCLTALLALAATPAAALDAPRDADRATIDTCLVKEKDAPARCVGTLFQSCISAPRGPNDRFPPDSTAGQGDCAAREIAVWDEKMDASLAALRAGPLGQTEAQPWNRPPQNKRERPVSGVDIIDDMQKTWLSWRAKKCDTEAMQYEGGTLSRVVYIKCVLEETGRHALWLKQQVEDNAPH